MTTTVTTPVETSPAFFQSIYAEADGNAALLPWDQGRAAPALVNWLNAVAPSLVRCGGRVAVVGCGLGHDARELIRRGYEVTAFDCAEIAVAWAQSLDPANAACYHQADLFDLPGRWKHRFDLVVEINTLQSLNPEQRPAALRAIGDLCASHGRALVIGHAADEPAPPEAGPPWILTEAELMEAATLGGLRPEGPVSCFDDDSEDPPVRRVRAVLVRT